LVRVQDLSELGSAEVGGFGEVREPFEEAHWVIAFFAGILEDAGDASGVKGLEEFFALSVALGVAVHAHGLAEIAELIGRSASLKGGVEGLSVYGAARSEAVGFEDQGREMQLPGAFDLSFGSF
jgi:hypothetical protein